MSNKNELRIIIKKTGDGYQLMAHPSGNTASMELAATHNEIDRVSLKLWSDHMFDYHSNFLNKKLSEANQLQMGRLLFAPIGKLFPQYGNPTKEKAHIWLESTAQEILRLPWSLIAHEQQFLHNLGWTVSYTTKRKATPEVELPETPRILVALPQPVGQDTTQAKVHFEDLEERLSAKDYRFSPNRNLRRVYTWSQFLETLQEWQPHLLYYYGFGMAMDPDSREWALMWAEGDKRHVVYQSAAKLGKLLNDMKNKPQLAYFNGFQGDADSMLRFGLELSDTLDAVVVNRGQITEHVARRQAVNFWDDLLTRPNCSPHEAIANLPQEQSSSELAWKSDRWALPVLFRHYGQWTNHPPDLRDKIADPHWRLKVDRRQQYGMVAEDCRQMFRNRLPRTLAYIWYGQQGQGIDLFHKRLAVQLGSEMDGVDLLTIRPRWPENIELTDPDDLPKLMEEMILEAFDTHDLDRIPGIIRTRSGGTTDRNSMLYVRHEPANYAMANWLAKIGLGKTPTNQLPLEALQVYLRWWDQIFNPLLETAHAYGLLGISFATPRPNGFREKLDRIRMPNLATTVYHILDELGRVTSKDVTDFLLAHKIDIPLDQHNATAEKILKKSDGDYEKTLAHLVEMAAKVKADVKVKLHEYDVFLSHNQADKSTARQLAEKLESDGLRVYFDEWVIKPGDDISMFIDNGLSKSSKIVLMMSADAFASDWVSLEYDTVINRDPSNRQRRLIPLLLADCAIPGIIKRLKYIDYRAASDEAYQQLVTAIKSRPN